MSQEKYENMVAELAKIKNCDKKTAAKIIIDAFVSFDKEIKNR